MQLLALLSTSSRLPCFDTALSHIGHGERTLKLMAATMSVTASIMRLSPQVHLDSWSWTAGHGCCLVCTCAVQRLKAFLNGESHSVGDRGAICHALGNITHSALLQLLWTNLVCLFMFCQQQHVFHMNRCQPARTARCTGNNDIATTKPTAGKRQGWQQRHQQLQLGSLTGDCPHCQRCKYCRLRWCCHLQLQSTGHHD